MTRSMWVVVCAVLLVVAGCSGAEDGPVDSGGDQAGPPVGQTDASATSEGDTVVALPPDVPLTYYADMARIAETYGLDDPPPVTPLRAVGPQETPQLMVDCLNEGGFPAQLSEDGMGFEIALGPGQQEDYNRAFYVCMGRYPTAEQYAGPLTEHQRRVYYDWQVEQVLPCMRDLDVQVPEPPSWEAYRTSEMIFFLDVGMDQETMAEQMALVMSNCEYVPPDDLLYPTD